MVEGEEMEENNTELEEGEASYYNNNNIDPDIDLTCLSYIVRVSFLFALDNCSNYYNCLFIFLLIIFWSLI